MSLKRSKEKCLKPRSSYTRNHINSLTRRTFHISYTEKKRRSNNTIVNTHDQFCRVNFYATTVIKFICAHSMREQTEGTRWWKQETMEKDKEKFFRHIYKYKRRTAYASLCAIVFSFTAYFVTFIFPLHALRYPLFIFFFRVSCNNITPR